MMSEKRISTVSAEEARERRARGESRTDLRRVRGLTETELDKAIASDRDWQDVPRDWWKDAELVQPQNKVLVSIRLDRDVVEWFKARGPGYQTRINAALRAFIKAQAT